MNTMMGDLIKAFGESGLYQVSEVAENYSVIPVYDENVLAQIENSHAWPLVLSKVASPNNGEHGGLDVWQADNVLYFHPIIDAKSDGIISKTARFHQHVVPILNSHKDVPDFKDNLEWTRQMSVYSGKQFNGNYSVLDCGLEVVISYTFVSPKSTGDGINAVSCGSCLLEDAVSSTGVTATQFSALMSAISQFDWHPFFYRGTLMPDGANESYGEVYFYGDVKVFTTVSPEVVARVHQCANYSVYYDPNLF